MKYIFLLYIIFQAGVIEAKSLPNFVFFIADDLGVYHTSPYGADWIRTPNIQALADQGLKFNLAYVASPSCTPSRAALMTGLMPYNNGIVGNHEKIRKFGVKPLLPLLNKLGYEIVWHGKVGHGSGSYSGKNIKIIETKDFRPTPEELEEYLKNRANPEKPIAIFFGCRYPHRPWPEPEDARIKAEEVKIPEKTFDTPETRSELTRYVEAVEIIDRKLGGVNKLINQYLDAENTVTFFTSDHGQAWPFGKWSLYETGIRTPLIVKWPGKIKPNSNTEAMVSWIDLIPTIIDIAGGTIPWNIDDKSFKEVLLVNKTVHHELIFGVHKGDNEWNVYPIRSVRNKEWKYIYNLYPELYRTTHMDLVKNDSKSARFYNRNWDSWVKAAKKDSKAAEFLQAYHSRPKEELYRVNEDPFEKNNVAGIQEYQEVLEEMRSLVLERMKEVGDDSSLSGSPKYLKDNPTSYTHDGQ